MAGVARKAPAKRKAKSPSQRHRSETPARAQAGHGRRGQGLEDRLVRRPGCGRSP